MSALYRMARDLGEMLVARKFPIVVEYGPEQTTRAPYQNAIVIERDRDGSETISAAHGLNRNPKKVLGRFMPVRALVFACSTVGGARREDHEYECDRFVDGLMSSLEEWATRAKTVVTFTGASFAKPGQGIDAAELETWPGVVYVVSFAVGRGVYARDYTGAGQPEGTVAGAGMSGTINVRRNGAEPPEVVEIG